MTTPPPRCSVTSMPRPLSRGRAKYVVKVFKTLELALYHNLGALPEPVEAHRFF
jgi:hypothetical protein